MKVARFDFAPALRPLLKREKRDGLVELNFQGSQSLKHLIESLGIPHTEVGDLLANKKHVGLDYLTGEGDDVQVWPVQPLKESVQEPRFVLDGHLGRLVSHLRMLGLDCLYRNDYEDNELVQISLDQGRILLTRDRRLLMHKILTQGCLIRSLDSRDQLKQVFLRFDLARWVKPFQRCLRCNHPLQPVSKSKILPRLKPLTKKYFREFHLCPNCDQIYWKGSHYERMLAVIEKVSGETQQ